MNKIIDFLITARTKTYAGNMGSVEPLLLGSKQLEYSKDNMLYRDIYNIGKGKFVGLETIYLDDKPVWSMSYYGNFEKMKEEDIDRILRKALTDRVEEVRLWNEVEYKIDDNVYKNVGVGDEEEFNGGEEIIKDGEVVYFFYYASALIA